MTATPSDRRYTKSHEWVRSETGEIVVGITDHAQSELTDIVFVDLPRAGRAVKQGESVLVLESVKTVSDIYAPVDGTIASANEALKATPGLINQDPYGKGWIYRLKPSGSFDGSALLDASAYDASVASGSGSHQVRRSLRTDGLPALELRRPAFEERPHPFGPVGRPESVTGRLALEPERRVERGIGPLVDHGLHPREGERGPRSDRRREGLDLLPGRLGGQGPHDEAEARRLGGVHRLRREHEELRPGAADQPGQPTGATKSRMDPYRRLRSRASPLRRRR